MRFAIMGAGAVGCYYGGMLARAGHEVTLVARAAHVEAIQQHGLRLQTRDWTEHIALRATTEAAGVQGADAVLFCVKSTDTETAGTQMRAHLSPHTTVFSLQNGVDNAPRLAAVLGRPVIPTVVYVACGMAGPGHVQHHGRGELVIGPFPGANDFIAACAQAGIGVSVSERVQGELWTKLVINCAYNALSALTQLPYARLVQLEGMWAVMRDIERECLAVAAAEGVTVPGDTWAAIEGIAQSMATQLSSTARDLLRGHPSEIDHINGYVVRRAEAHGLQAPANRLLHALVRAREAGSGRACDNARL
ncbi:ketopantoate reductase family protein [Tepidicella baoligensis]|uniref:ketopantoate reductase family protein n=1 Tax=Tepidicella baoligensis TaxID=2707016 RepID=UPI0015DAFE7F|nr:2-dehydropantoate 2-reductase [Tepidicella baoligensis]